MQTPTQTETWTQTDTNAARRALQCAALAVSEFSLGNEPASETAAYRAGQLTAKSGFTVDQLAAECPALVGTGNCWTFAVDGYHDAKEAA